MKDSNLTKEKILRLAKEKNIGFIKMWFVDVLGTIKSFTITRSELEKALTALEAKE